MAMKGDYTPSRLNAFMFQRLVARNTYVGLMMMLMMLLYWVLSIYFVVVDDDDDNDNNIVRCQYIFRSPGTSRKKYLDFGFFKMAAAAILDF